MCCLSKNWCKSTNLIRKRKGETEKLLSFFVVIMQTRHRAETTYLYILERLSRSVFRTLFTMQPPKIASSDFAAFSPSS